MRKLANLVLTGLLTVLPVALTLWVLFWAFSSLESLVGPFIPAHWYFPGVGILTGLALLVAVGLLVHGFVFRLLINLSDRLLEKIPLVKSLYAALQDVATLFNQNKHANLNKAVMVEVSEGMQLIGFITNEEVGKTLLANEDVVAVYMPFSYQIGGYTLYVSRSKLTPLDIPVEQAMRMAITGSGPGKAKKSNKLK